MRHLSGRLRAGLRWLSAVFVQGAAASTMRPSRRNLDSRPDPWLKDKGVAMRRTVDLRSHRFPIVLLAAWTLAACGGGSTSNSPTAGSGPSKPASTAVVAVATPIDGVWMASWTKDELAASTLLQHGEFNDYNWGQLTLTFKQGRFKGTQKNARKKSSDSGTLRVVVDTLVIDRDDNEHFVMRWSLKGDQLTLTGDEALGIGPTPYVMKPWVRQS
jgi:hypothetical protein